MAMYGQGKTRGTVAILEIDAAVNQACAAITVKDGKSKFLFYQLKNSYQDIRKLSNTGNQENLNADIIKDGAGIGRVRLCEAKSSTIGTMGCIHARKGISIIFLYYLLEQVDFNKYSNGSTIPHLYYKDYSCEKVRIPDIKEQAAIAEVLSTADREIELLQQDIEQEKQKKKALMQLLLMGIVRVKI